MQAYTDKLLKIQETTNSIAQLEGRLSNKNYVDKAPKELVEQTKQQLKDAKTKLEQQQAQHERFS